MHHCRVAKEARLQSALTAGRKTTRPKPFQGAHAGKTECRGVKTTLHFSGDQKVGHTLGLTLYQHRGEVLLAVLGNGHPRMSLQRFPRAGAGSRKHFLESSGTTHPTVKI